MSSFPKIKAPFNFIKDGIQPFKGNKKSFEKHIESGDVEFIFLLTVAIYEYLFWTSAGELEKKYEFINQIHKFFKEFYYYVLHHKKNDIDFNNKQLAKIIIELEVLYQYLDPNGKNYDIEKVVNKKAAICGLFDKLRKHYLNEFDDMDLDSSY